MQRFDVIDLNPEKQPEWPVRRAAWLYGRLAQERRKWLVILMLVFSDILLAVFTWEAASLSRELMGFGALTDVAVTSIVPSIGIWVGLRALMGLYPGYGLDQVEELRRQTYAVLATLAIATIFALIFQVGDSLSRLLLVLGFMGLAVFAPVARHFMKWVAMKAGIWGKPVVVLGASKAGADLLRTLQREWQLGLRPVAVFDNRRVPEGGMLAGVPYGGTLEDASGAAQKYGVDTAILAMPRAYREHLAHVVDWVSMNFRNVIVVPDLSGVANSGVVARDLAGTFGMEIKHNLLNPWARGAKRAVDLLATVAGGVLISPLFLALALLVWLESRGTVFYRDQRMGRNGKLFSCIKFQTMVPDAEAALQRLLKDDAAVREEYFKYHKLRNDPRVTRIGRFLRKTSLDELPQLWNVLRGEMSLVGPRPYLPRESGDMGTRQEEILRVYPGITGLWQVNGRNHSSFTDRVQMDSYYVRNWSVWLDLVILARTLATVLLSRGAY